MGRHNQHHLVAATTAAPCASINLGLIVVLSVGSQGRNGRGQGVCSEESERERDSARQTEDRKPTFQSRFCVGQVS